MRSTEAINQVESLERRMTGLAEVLNLEGFDGLADVLQEAADSLHEVVRINRSQVASDQFTARDIHLREEQ